MTVPRMLGHRLVATSLLYTGDFEEGRTHLDRAIALYDPVEHRPLATRFGQDAAVSILCYRSWVLWFLGYPEAALTDTEHALRDAREIGHAATLMYALVHASLAHSYCGIYAAANAEAAEDVALANEIGSLFWAAFGTTAQGFVSALTGKVSDAVQTIASGLAALRPTGTRMWLPLYLSSLAGAYAELGQFDDAWRCIEEARTTMETTKERWWEAEAHRTAGEALDQQDVGLGEPLQRRLQRRVLRPRHRA